MKIKIELYQVGRNVKVNNKPKSQMNFLGYNLFDMGELMKTSMSILKKPILNPINPKLETKMNELNLGSKIVLRYEEVEQTNEFVTI